MAGLTSSDSDHKDPNIHHIVWLDRGAVRVPIRRPDFPHTWTEHAHTPPDQVIPRLQNATIAINNRSTITRELLSQCPKLQYIAMCATGYDCVDVAACKEVGIPVSNVREWAITVPEHVFALILALRRDVVEYREKTRAGEWQKSKVFTLPVQPLSRARALAGSTMGVVGLGVLAKKVVKIAEAFEMRVLVAERKGVEEAMRREGRVGFEEVIKSADVLVLLCPLTEETRDLLSEKELRSMKKQALLINCARGGVVNEEVLAKALREEWIAGAGVDTITEEPPTNGNVLLDPSIPNLIVTPHVGWASEESVKTLFEVLIGNIEHFAAGSPRNVVT